MKPPSVPFTSRGRSFVVFLRKRDVNNPAAPYYFRVDGRPLSTKQTTAEAAIREAKARLELRAQAPGDYAVALETLKARAGVTVGQLVQAWVAAGHPHPNGQPRTPAQRDLQDEALSGALPWWGDKPAVTITGPTLSEYSRARRAEASRAGFTGQRSVDLELTALSSCFAWAVATGQAQKNPFHNRPRFHSSSQVVHCSAYMPASDETLHAILRALLGSPYGDQVCAGAQLAFAALTGLRSGEPGFLRWDATWANGRPQPGLRYTTQADGNGPRELLAVRRVKNGINHAVTVHPALRDFLAAWEAYSRPRWSSAWYFPDPEDPTQPFVRVRDKRKRLCNPLGMAASALGLPKCTPHAFRAFYVRVRRSQGADDARIALELGQGSGPGLVVRIYGESHGIHGDGRFDWLPAAPAEPAWTLLARTGTGAPIPLDTHLETLGYCPTVSNTEPALSGQNQAKALQAKAQHA